VNTRFTLTLESRLPLFSNLLYALIQQIADIQGTHQRRMHRLVSIKIALDRWCQCPCSLCMYGTLCVVLFNRLGQVTRDGEWHHRDRLIVAHSLSSACTHTKMRNCYLRTRHDRPVCNIFDCNVSRNELSTVDHMTVVKQERRKNKRDHTNRDIAIRQAYLKTMVLGISQMRIIEGKNSSTIFGHCAGGGAPAPPGEFQCC